MDPSYYNFSIVSELERKDGTKLGLGSSAAVTVGIISTLCKHYNLDINNESLFKLASLANLSINKHSSCGDIAACVYGGWIAYKNFDREWVLEKQKDIRISELLNIDWPYLKIETLIPPKELILLVAWTGQAASTISLVGKMREKRKEEDKVYKGFLHNSERCVQHIIRAFKRNNIEEIQRQIHENRRLLVELGNTFNVEIETPLLKKLSDMSDTYGGSGKASGAGGGDCGIAIFNRKKNTNNLIEEWEDIGIIYLPINVYEEGDGNGK